MSEKHCRCQHGCVNLIEADSDELLCGLCTHNAQCEVRPSVRLTCLWCKAQEPLGKHWLVLVQGGDVAHFCHIGCMHHWIQSNQPEYCEEGVAHTEHEEMLITLRSIEKNLDKLVHPHQGLGWGPL